MEDLLALLYRILATFGCKRTPGVAGVHRGLCWRILVLIRLDINPELRGREEVSRESGILNKFLRTGPLC